MIRIAILAIFFVRIQGKMSVFSSESYLKIHVRAYHVSVYWVTHTCNVYTIDYSNFHFSAKFGVK